MSNACLRAVVRIKKSLSWVLMPLKQSSLYQIESPPPLESMAFGV